MLAAVLAETDTLGAGCGFVRIEQPAGQRPETRHREQIGRHSRADQTDRLITIRHRSDCGDGHPDV